jgi:hypothetical protein
MELVREFDLSQQKINHFPKKDGISGQRTALQPTMILITVHYTSFNASSYSTLNASKNRKYLKINNLEKQNIYCHELCSLAYTPHN